MCIKKEWECGTESVVRHTTSPPLIRSTPYPSYLTMRSHILCLILPAIVSANGHVDKVMADGVTYQGYNDGIGGQIPVPPTVTWRTNPIEPGLWGSRGEFSTTDVNCRFDGHSNSAYAKVKAGGELKVVWDYWDFGEPYKWPFPISE